MKRQASVGMFYLYTFLIVILISALTSCTDNSMVRYYGGEASLEISSDRKFSNVTWKDEDLWIVTKKREVGDTVKSTYYFTEKSSLGLKNGEYTIIEK